ncbi:MAG: hypothetical protein LBS24_06765 [Clostridiales Family XIII bacterium]|jgi:predicted nucleic acid-binding protein|nr:hypothetical protein [Clostridiales Family XIII bacterium]
MNEAYVLDTNIVSYFLKDAFQIADKIKQTFIAGDRVVINPITYYEIKKGLLSSGNRNKLLQSE